MVATVKEACEPQVKPVDVIMAAAMFGLLTGLLKLVILAAIRSFDRSLWLAWNLINRNFLWMIPTANLSIFLVVGALLALMARFWPKQAIRVEVYALSALAALTQLVAVPGLHIGASVLIAMGFASLFGPWIERNWPRLFRLARKVVPALVVIVVGLGVFSFSRAKLREAQALGRLPGIAPDSTNVLLIVLDTVRAESLSLYGSRRDTSPNLLRLAQEGVRFEQSLATAPWTLPSHASMFTGRWPHEHGADGAFHPLDTKYPTLAEVLQASGYVTAGFVGNDSFCHADYGLGRGFIHYEDLPISPLEVLRSEKIGLGILKVVDILRFKLSAIFGEHALVRLGDDPRIALTVHRRKNAAQINRDALDWLSSHQGKPFFAFLNYIDAHDPYFPPRGADRRFSTTVSTPADLAKLRNFWGLDRKKLSRRFLDVARDTYDDSIAYIDTQLGQLFDELSSRGLLKNTLVIITSDHGEGFGEHGQVGHAHSLYQHEIRVPLLVIGPQRVPKARVIPTPVSLRDIPATVVDLLGLGGEPPFPGQSLARFWQANRGSDQIAIEPVLSELSDTTQELRSDRLDKKLCEAVSLGDMVYIRYGDGRESLYNIAEDPAENDDLALESRSRPTLERLRATLAQLMRNAPPSTDLKDARIENEQSLQKR